MIKCSKTYIWLFILHMVSTVPLAGLFFYVFIPSFHLRWKLFSPTPFNWHKIVPRVMELWSHHSTGTFSAPAFGLVWRGDADRWSCGFEEEWSKGGGGSDFLNAGSWGRSVEKPLFSKSVGQLISGTATSDVLRVRTSVCLHWWKWNGGFVLHTQYHCSSLRTVSPLT